MARTSPVPEGFPTLAPAPSPSPRDGPKAPASDEHADGPRLGGMTAEELRHAAEEWARTSGMGDHDGG